MYEKKIQRHMKYLSDVGGVDVMMKFKSQEGANADKGRFYLSYY